MLAVLWLLVFIICLLFCSQQLIYGQPFYSNLFDLLPQDERKPAQHELSSLLAERFQDRVLILLRDDNSPDAVDQVRRLHALLSQSPVLSMDSPGEHFRRGMVRLYRPYSQQLLTGERRHWLATHSAADLAEQSYRELFTPMPTLRPYDFDRDPFNLGGHWIGQLTPQLAISEKHGFPIIADLHQEPPQQWYLISIQLLGSPFAPGNQQDLKQRLEQFKQQYPEAELLTSGMIFHATEGAERARHEIASVGLGSALGIILLVIWVFRSPLPLLAVLLSLASGCLLALTVSLLVFGKIHFVTLAFGSTLLGIAVDYVFHFLITSHQTRDGERARYLLRYAMAVGALSTVSAFLLQLTTPFPGLRQMAVFSSAGLVGAWLTVLAMAPFYRLPRHRRITPGAWSAYRLFAPIYRGLRRAPRTLATALLALVCGALYSIWQGGANDSIASLNTSSAALIASESRVQSLLKSPSTNRFFLVQADDEERLLQRLQALSREIEKLNGEPVRFLSLSQFVPPQSQQDADRKLVKDTLYGTGGALPLLCGRLGISCDAPPGSFGSDETVLSPSIFSKSVVHTLAPPVIQVPENSAPGQSLWYSLLLLSSNSQHPQLPSLANRMDGVVFVEQSAYLSQLLGRYRVGIARIWLLTLGFLGLLLGIRYRSRCWQVIMPLAIALLVALGAAALQGITVFHLMALLLVLGIGLDTAIFYLEVGLSRETWLASSLSSCTSILAFGLLSLSKIPVLQQFGIVVIAGILSCWLLTPLFFSPDSHVGGSEDTRVA